MITTAMKKRGFKLEEYVAVDNEPAWEFAVYRWGRLWARFHKWENALRDISAIINHIPVDK